MSSITNLRTSPAFLGFQSCPRENVLDTRYYNPEDKHKWLPTRNWCLLAEILDSSTTDRLRLLARDRDGHDFVVAFYLEPDDTSLNPSKFRQGHTVAILYPIQHRFSASSVFGVKQEEIKCVQVIPLSLSDNFALSDRVKDHNTPVDGKYECHTCGAEKELLVTCGDCNLFHYCDKDCQIRGWTEKNHWKDCKVLKDIKGFFTLEWGNWYNFVNFPL